MDKLDFDYTQSGDYVASYAGLTIRAIRDDCAENPFENWDFMTPCLWTSGDSLQEDSAGDIESPLDLIPSDKLKPLWNQLCAALDIDAAESDRHCKADKASYGGRLADYRRDCLTEVLNDKRPGGFRSWKDSLEYLEALCGLWTLAGFPANTYQRNGYSQGDSIYALFVSTPAFLRDSGLTKRKAAALGNESEADLLAAYCFGDVYGYAIETESGETLDSCFGFYGDDMDKSGLSGAALDMVRHYIGGAAARRLNCLKALIKNRVPLALRPAMLESAARIGAN